MRCNGQAIELCTPQGAEMVSGMIYEPYEPYEAGVIMRLEHHLVHILLSHIIIIIIILLTMPMLYSNSDTVP